MGHTKILSFAVLAIVILGCMGGGGSNAGSPPTNNPGDKKTLTMNTNVGIISASVVGDYVDVTRGQIIVIELVTENGRVSLPVRNASNTQKRTLRDGEIVFVMGQGSVPFRITGGPTEVELNPYSFSNKAPITSTGALVDNILMDGKFTIMYEQPQVGDFRFTGQFLVDIEGFSDGTPFTPSHRTVSITSSIKEGGRAMTVTPTVYSPSGFSIGYGNGAGFNGVQNYNAQGVPERTPSFGTSIELPLNIAGTPSLGVTFRNPY